VKIFIQSFFMMVFLFLLVLTFGKLAFVDPIVKETSELQAKTSKLQAEEAEFRKKLAQIKPADVSLPSAADVKLLRPGEEQDLFKNVIAHAASAGVLINSFKISDALKVKPEGEAEFSSSSESKTGKGELPQFDANGNPIGVETDKNEEGKEIEFVPLVVGIKGTFRSWGKFLHELTKNLPFFIIRTMKISFDGSGLGKGSLCLVFPLGKPRK